MLGTAISTLKTWFPAPEVQAHCDGPCGVYDPSSARIAAEAVVSMTKKILDLQHPEDGDTQAMASYQNTMSRFIAIKEEQAQITKDELLILWTDYFKPVHLHLRVALRVLARLEQEKARASMTAGAFSHIDFGWIAVDRRCQIVDMDEQAQRFLSRSAALREGPYRRLIPSSPSIDRQLTSLVKSFAENPEARPRAVNLSQDPWIDILVSPVRVSSLSVGGGAVAVVYFRGDQSSSADRCQQLIDVFKLTQSEARFAWSIAQGISIADAAEKHGLTIETARNYSKKIYAKTGARGQVDFMRRVLTSVVAITVH